MHYTESRRSFLAGAVCSLYAVLFFFCSFALGDQNDARLESLFTDLKQTSAANEGSAITRQIWKVWDQAPDDEAQLIFNRGVAFMAQEDYRSSLISFTQVTQLNPDFAEAWNRRATLLYILGAFELSLQDIERTLDLEPRHFGAISGRGQIYMRQDKLLLARKAFEQALDINPHLDGVKINIKNIDRLLSENSI